MGLTYDGITYRSLEEQVRYDAEQIQILKQADVTINENLQTVNENLQTEINGKLTKPANPSAESAVTMLSDGTVGTKLLSEIGGGGGKLYKHEISFTSSGVSNTIITFVVFSTQSTAYTLQEVFTLFDEQTATFSSSRGSGAVMCNFFSTDGNIWARISGVVSSIQHDPLILFQETYNNISLHDNCIEL